MTTLDANGVKRSNFNRQVKTFKINQTS